MKSPVDVAGDGTFEARGLAAGTYRLIIGNDIEFVSRIELGSKFIEGSRFELPSPGSDQVVVTLSKDGATLDGSVEGTFTPDSPAHGVVGIIQRPATVLELTTLRFVPVLPTGSFKFGKLEPGDYRVCGWLEDAQPAGIMTNPRYQEKLDRACASVKVKLKEPGQVKVHQLTFSEIER
jgi:hypothetical protein